MLQVVFFIYSLNSVVANFASKQEGFGLSFLLLYGLEVAILGVCNIQYKMKADGSVYPAMGLSLTYDHRAVDGAPASRFMQELCRMLENFSVTLAL